MFISACLIIKNEEQVIERCIKSFKDAVDEIIVVDTGSTDRSLDIARSLGAAIYPFEWVNDFSAARNFAISKARGEWIIFLDADEFFEEGNAHALASSLDMVKSYDTISVKLVNITNQMEILDEVYLCRVFKNNKLIEYKNPIHETVYKKKGKIKNAIFSDVVVFHTGYDKSLIQKQDKIDRNYNLLMAELNKNPNDYITHAYLTDHYLLDKQWDNAIKHAREAINNAKSYEDIFVSKAYIGMLQAMSLAEKDATERIAVVNEGLKRLPLNSDIHYCAGVEAFLQKRYKEAVYFLEEALRLQKNMRTSKIPGLLESIYYRLYVSYYALDQYNNALESLRRMLKVKKDQNDIVIEWLFLISKLPEDKQMEEVSKIFDLKNNQEVYYLLTQAVKLRSQSLVNRLYHLLNIPEKHMNVIALYVLFINKRYTQATKHFFSIFEKEQNEEYGLVTFLCGLLTKDYELLLGIQGITSNSSLKKIIRCYLGETITLTLDEKSFFLNIVQDLILLGEYNLLSEVLELLTLFDIDLSVDLGLLFYKYKLFDASLDCFEKIYQDSKNPDILMKMAKILMQSNRMHEAIGVLSLCLVWQLDDFEVFRLTAEIAQCIGDLTLKEQIINYVKKTFYKIGENEIPLLDNVVTRTIL